MAKDDLLLLLSELTSIIRYEVTRITPDGRARLDLIEEQIQDAYSNLHDSGYVK